jgi:hypothetical protein
MSLTANSDSPSQVPLKWSSKHPLYLESEVEMDESKLRFIPYKLTQLQVAIKTDMKGILQFYLKCSRFLKPFGIEESDFACPEAL